MWGNFLLIKAWMRMQQQHNERVSMIYNMEEAITKT
jgi:hypothetical protein